MTLEERLRKALNHKEPEGVPFDLNGTETSGISIVTLKRWRGKVPRYFLKKFY